MTAIRKSYLIAIEDGFGTGQAKDDKWYPMPQGFYLSWSASTQASSLYGTGAKIRQNSIYGSFQGSWNASYVMDFNNLEFLSIIFDTEDNDSPEAIDSTDTTKANFLTEQNGVYEHVFRKINNRRQRSYVIKERVLNKIANGDYDEENVLKGFLARNIQIARSTSGSQMALEMSGVFADKYTTLFDSRLDSFFVPINDPLTQYSCMYMGLNATPEDEDAVEQVDSHSINIETSVSLVYSTCSPIATDFFEDKSTFAWNATAYMNNPTKKFKLLSNSGGTLNPKTTITTPDGHHARQPMGKNLAPLEYVNFITYDESKRDAYHGNYLSVVDAYLNSPHVVWVQARNSTVKSTTTPKGDGSKLQDSLSSVECDEIIIRVRNNKPMIWNDNDVYTGSGITPTVATFTQPIIENVTDSAYVFTIPVSGYQGVILANVIIPQSEAAMTTMKLDGQNGAPDLREYIIVEEADMMDSTNTYRLDNLIPKQLTDPGGQPTGGLAVTTISDTISGSPSWTGPCPQISGTPSIVRTDYYFIVKKDTSGSTPVYSTGYLRVAVR